MRSFSGLSATNSFGRKLLCGAMSAVLAIGLMPMPWSAIGAQTAYAEDRVVCYDDGDLDTYDTLIDADSCVIKTVTTTTGKRQVYTYEIRDSGSYKLAEGLSNLEITISSDATDVRFIGNGIEYNGDITDDPYNDNTSNVEGFGYVYSTPNINVSIDATQVECGRITLQDLYVNNASFESNKNFISFNETAESTLRFEGTSIIDHYCANYGVSGASDACFHVGNDATLNIEGDGTVYGYKWSSGAFIGGNYREMNGTINFHMDSTGMMLVKGTKQSAVIGAGAAATSATEAQVPGPITFESGNYYILTNSRGAAIGGSAGSNGGSKGTSVTVSGSALLSINTDYSGAVIGGGGYVTGNDASGGTLTYAGGTVRPYMDVNSASNVGTGWQGRTVTAGVCDAAITAQRVNEGGDTVYFMTVPGGGSEYVPHEVVIDGNPVYSGESSYAYEFMYSDRNRGGAGDKDPNVNVYPRSDIGNWYPVEDSNFYVFATGEDHEVTCDERTYNATFVPVVETVDVYEKDENGDTVYQKDEDGNYIKDAAGALVPVVIGQETKVTSASYFELTCANDDHEFVDGKCKYCGKSEFNVLKGDVNNNEKVNTVDAQIVCDMANDKYGEEYADLLAKLAEAGTTWTYAMAVAAADYNEDGTVDSLDARAIQSSIFG